MASHADGRLTPAAGRRFAFTLAVAFALLALLVAWRGVPTASRALGTLAAVLAVLGVAVPTRLGPLERAWMGLAHALSRVTTPIFMGVVYFAVITPTALVMRALGRAPLRRRAATSYWQRRPDDARRSELSRQF